MKKIKYFIFIIFSIFILTGNIKALTYKNEITNSINNAISYKDYYITIKEESSNTIIEKVDYENQIISSKQLNNLTNAEIIKYENNYLVAGKNNNNLEVYLLDQNNTIISTNKSDIIIPNSKFNLTSYENKIYLYLTNDTILSNNIIYEIDNELNIIENNLSTYTNLKDILGTKYDEINSTGEVIDNKINYYNESLKTEKYQILVGYNELNLSVIKIINLETNEIITKEDNTCLSYEDIDLINNELIVLCKSMNNESEFRIYDTNLNIKDSKPIGTTEPKKLIKLKNYLVVITNNNLVLYEYDTNIIKEESLYGTLTIEGNNIPYEKVSYSVVPNSGYEIDQIIIKDEYGNLINTENNAFIMPESKAYFSVVYKEVVENPNTLDSIYIIVLILIISVFIFKYVYTKYKWLN